MTIGSSDSDPRNFHVFNDKLYFSADNDSSIGRELYVFDGTSVSMAANIEGRAYYDSDPHGFAEYNSKLYFVADNATYGEEVFVFDGSTVSVIDINLNDNDALPSELTVYNNKLYFSATDGTYGNELWVYDGTTKSMVVDINQGSGNSSPRAMMVYNSKLYLFAYDGSDVNLYSYDGSSGVVVQSDLSPPYYSDGDNNKRYIKPIVFNNKLLFIAASDGYSYYLYSYDGN